MRHFTKQQNYPIEICKVQISKWIFQFNQFLYNWCVVITVVFQVYDSAFSKAKLKEMFPDLPDAQINEVINGWTTIEECIASILDSNHEG